MDVIEWKRKAIPILFLYNLLVENQTMCEYLIHLCLRINNIKFKFSIKSQGIQIRGPKFCWKLFNWPLIDNQLTNYSLWNNHGGLFSFCLPINNILTIIIIFIVYMNSTYHLPRGWT
jgi:hypothetical protein